MGKKQTRTISKMFAPKIHTIQLKTSDKFKVSALQTHQVMTRFGLEFEGCLLVLLSNHSVNEMLCFLWETLASLLKRTASGEVLCAVSSQTELADDALK